MRPSRPANDGQKPVHARRRNRARISCNHCRIRKLKCSRTQPCDSCFRTGDSDTCSYATQLVHQNNNNPLDQNTKEVLTARITKLENLLSSVITPADQSPNFKSSGNHKPVTTSESTGFINSDTGYHEQKKSSSPDVDNASRELGQMKVDYLKDQTIYLSGDHWTSIMSEVDELKRRLVDVAGPEDVALKTGENQSHFQRSASLLRGFGTLMRQEDILSYLPARPIVDTVVNRFFEVFGSTFAFIHEPTFRKEYNDHWSNPLRTKIIWLGLLFAILHGAEVSYIEEGEDSFWDQHELPIPSIGFNSLVVQCLIASDYTNPVAYTIETLMLYVQFEGIVPPNGGIETSVVLGVTIRLAMRMGIHRNSKAHGLTPFQDEMRRRLWATLLIADTLHSFQLSLPPAIGQKDSNCALPTNILNAEFGPASSEFPPPRPFSEYTEITYTILKVRFLLIFKDIMISVNSSDDMSEQEVRNFESALSEVDAAIPPSLQIFPAGGSATAIDADQSQRISFDRMHQLCRCMLYRKFLHRARTDPSLTQYRLLCIDAAMKLLRHQAILFHDSDSVFSATVRKQLKRTHPTLDFFLAGMIIALDLYHGLQTTTTSPLEEYPNQAEMVAALENSNDFWKIAGDQTSEAAKAHHIFSFVLQKVRNSRPTTTINLGEPEKALDILPTDLDFSYNILGPSKEFAEFDWDNWNAYVGNDVNFDTFLQWPPTI